MNCLFVVGEFRRSRIRASQSCKRRNLLALLVCSIVSAVGCSDGEVRLSTHKVSGTILRKGAGVANATVIFHPCESERGFPKPRAITRADGSFEMTTYEASDGAPVGEYQISVEQWIRTKPEESPTNRLPPSLSQSSSSGLKAIVAASENRLPPFVLK